jgi:hypothetical protein
MLGAMFDLLNESVPTLRDNVPPGSLDAGRLERLDTLSIWMIHLDDGRIIRG